MLGKIILFRKKIEFSMASVVNLTYVQSIKLWFDSYFGEKPFACPKEYNWTDEEGGEKRKYELTTLQRFFVTMHEPSSCIGAQWISNFVMAVILLNIIVNVMMTLPQYRRYPVSNCAAPACDNDATLCPGIVVCTPISEPWLTGIDDICVILFSIEYLMRIVTVWSVPVRLSNLLPPEWDEEEKFCAKHEEREQMLEPAQNGFNVVYSYFWSLKNLIDVIAIIPFYITLINPNTDASLSFIRVLRLFRIVRAFKMNASAGVTNLIIKTVTESMEVIMLLIFFAGMIILIYGFVIFDTEIGTYVVTAEYPDGAYIRQDIEGNEVKSPFSSTLLGMYWAVVTMTTVGYGDIYPVTVFGRILAVTCAFVGVLFMALPISILGANFTVQYQRLNEVQRIERKRKQTMMLANKASVASGKEIKIDLDYEVNKAIGEQEKKERESRPTTWGGINGKGTTGSRNADTLIHEKDMKAIERAKYLHKREQELEMTPMEADRQRGYSLGSIDEYSTSGSIKGGSTENNSLSPRSPRRADRSGSTGSIEQITDNISEAIDKMTSANTAEEKMVIMIASTAELKNLSQQLTQDVEDDLRVATFRAKNITESCTSLVDNFSNLLKEQMIELRSNVELTTKESAAAGGGK